MKDLLIELHYLPTVEYFKQVISHDVIHLEACENYQKQTYRNRCEVLTSNKVSTLAIPVKAKKRLISTVEIDYNQSWLNDHWRTIVSAYNNSPYFEHYEYLFHDLFFKKHRYLIELNQELFSLCLKLLQIDKEVVLTTDYHKEVVNSMDDFREKIHPKKEIISSTYFSYHQNFGEKFEPNLSIIDLLFCEGNNALQVLKQSLEITK